MEIANKIIQNVINLFNQKTIETYFNVIEQTPLPTSVAYFPMDPWPFLDTLYNNIKTLGTNKLMALNLTPYLQDEEVAFLWTFIFDSSCLDSNAICNWLNDDCYTPVFTNQGNITIVTINATI